MSRVKRILAVFLCAALCIGCVACEGTTTEPTFNRVEIWSALNTEKILQEVDYSDKGETKFEVQAYRNETEAGQIIITPDGRVASYNLTVADLKSANGATLAADSFEIFHQKYVHCIKPTSGNLPTGWYPDALLPIENAILHGENTIAANQNQGIYITVSVPKDQAVGVYTGSFQLTLDGKTFTVPASVEVWDYTLSDENHLRSVFSVQRYWGEGCLISGELDSSWEMYEKYYDYLREFRISTRYLPGSNKDAETFVENALKATLDPKITTYVLPYIEVSGGINMDYYTELMDRMMAASVTNGVDLFAKCVTYFAMFDEANNRPADLIVANNVLSGVKAKNAALAITYREKYKSVPSAKLEALIASMKDVVQLYVDEDEGKLADGLGETYCPLVRDYHTQDRRDHYQEINPNERWWYTCVTPTNPYPSYHIDDNLYSSRIMSWMQYKYDVVGNLYWSTVYWLDKDGKPLQDYYNNAEHFLDANGDGYLLYPGKVYDVDGPVGSLRLHGIRDGMEDYEVLYALGELTQAAANAAGTTANVQNVLAKMYDRMFSGTQVSTDSETVLEMRRTLADLMITAEKTGVVILDATAGIADEMFRVFVPNGSTFTADGAHAESVTGGKIYTVTVPMSGEQNAFTMTATKDGKDYTVSLSLGGKKTHVTAEAFLNDITVESRDKATKVAGDAYGMTGDAVQLAFAATTETSLIKSQRFTYKPSGFDSYDRNNLKLLLNVYAEEDNLNFEMHVRGESNPVYFSVYSGKLKKGNNVVTINLGSFNWTQTGKLEQMRFTVGGASENPQRTVVIGNAVYWE